jgi:hypothetical protein
MKPNNAFDDLARRKLDERAFPFEEAHWTAMRETLGGSMHGARRRSIRWIPALLLLLLSVAWWWSTSGPKATPELSSTAPASSSLLKGSDRNADRNRKSSVPIADTSSSAEMTRTDRTRSSRGAQQASTAALSVRSAPRNEDMMQHLALDQGPPSGSDGIDAIRATPAPGVSHFEVGYTLAGKAMVGVAEMDLPNERFATDSSHRPLGTGIGTPVTDVEGVSLAPLGATLPVVPEAATEHSRAAPGAAPSDDGTTDALENRRPSGSLDAHAYVLEAPMDSATAGPTLALIEPPFSKQSPWELGLLGGAALSQIRYEGTGSRDWSEHVGSEWAPTYGIEALYTCRNFGIGTGLHMGTYAERITAGAVDRSAWNTSSYWFITSVDTTILLITDTVQVGGQTFYTGQSFTVSVPVLAQGVDSTETSVRIRDARSMTNRVSYVEVPLLLDGHLVQGRWNFGLRGGPTLGLLSRRLGSLPDMGNSGYTDLVDQAFREVVLGWTARAFARYRFNAGWSLGVEPMLRGQFGNGLYGDALSRRSNAAGVVMSISYRMR